MVSRNYIFVLLIAIGCMFPTALWGDANDDAEAIRDTYLEWVASTNARDIDRWATFVAPGAVFLPPGTAPLESKESITAFYAELFDDPNFSLACSQRHVEIADSGELAWSRGICAATFSLPDGTVGQGSSKWVKVWVLSEDGQWKCRLNTWNSD